MALKLDMSKAYDRVEWSFVPTVMSKMQFPQQWINTIQNCLKLSVLLHPFLTSILNRAERSRALTPVQIGRGPISVSHLFFAANNFMFCQANTEELNCVLNILNLYERASGQVLNKEKSSIFFSKNTKPVTQQKVLQLVGLKSSGAFEKYLGLPTFVGRAKVSAFHSLVDRTWSRVANWKTKHLSVAGKETLLKEVLQAIPIYAMGMFLLPVSIIRKLNQLLRKFWWGFNEDTSKIKWVCWDKISTNKESGGLGFRDFKKFNLALLSRQGLRIIQNPNSLVSMVLK
ncbi:uncharacterized protein LOC121249421 [Juglans microcarpa x Juglans regia]|uniref:uncharacterized protein LOC121249421 n=1 Tax=Juglans microcarpa x Juglans regia TaxID=2249226 RepID=UPI001B7DED7E|nr:uncharacterized protein LOC121249421 [Juglans microcarpa x Juglans regia]